MPDKRVRRLVSARNIKKKKNTLFFGDPGHSYTGSSTSIVYSWTENSYQLNAFEYMPSYVIAHPRAPAHTHTHTHTRTHAHTLARTLTHCPACASACACAPRTHTHRWLDTQTFHFMHLVITQYPVSIFFVTLLEGT